MTWLGPLLTLTAYVAFGIVLGRMFWRQEKRVMPLELNDAAQDARLAALEERVALLEVPEVIHRATKQHVLRQSLLKLGGQVNGFGGRGEEGS